MVCKCKIMSNPNAIKIMDFANLPGSRCQQYQEWINVKNLKQAEEVAKNI
jgi:hypothetical protein